MGENFSFYEKIFPKKPSFEKRHFKRSMNILIEKKLHRLSLLDGEAVLFTCPVALGRDILLPKEWEGDGRTPEGCYRVCLVMEKGKYGRSLGLSYPSVEDAEAALADGRIDEATHRAIKQAHCEERRPPWGSPLGGEIYLHEGGSKRDWTQGCIALESRDMDKIFPLREQISEIRIVK